MLLDESNVSGCDNESTSHYCLFEGSLPTYPVIEDFFSRPRGRTNGQNHSVQLVKPRIAELLHVSSNYENRVMSYPWMYQVCNRYRYIFVSESDTIGLFFT